MSLAHPCAPRYTDIHVQKGELPRIVSTIIGHPDKQNLLMQSFNSFIQSTDRQRIHAIVQQFARQFD